MSANKIPSFNKGKYLNLSEDSFRWTKQAIQCYERHCICKGCIIHDSLENECIMKLMVRKIYEKHGKPPKEKYLDIDKIIELMEDGVLIKDIAVLMGVRYEFLNQYLKKNGIDGRYFIRIADKKRSK